MAFRRRATTMDYLLLLAILAVAFAARTWYLAAFTEYGKSPSPWHVQEVVAKAHENETQPQADRDALLQNLRERRWFGSKAPLAKDEEKTAHISPGYIWSLYWLEQLPLGGASLQQRAFWLQCLLGALTAGLYCWLAL